MIGEQVTCSNCGVARPRGIVHRCSAPGLIHIDQATAKVLRACIAAGGHPIIVGGTVRDAIIGRDDETVTAKDVDIEVHGVTSHAPLAEQLDTVGRVDLAGAHFGILKVVVDHQDFDIALPRIEVISISTALPVRTTSESDLDDVSAFSRRDFTMNAMGWDPATEELVDPFGGTADILAGVLRHVGPSFEDDPLRVLRAMQLSARFELALAPETAAMARSLADAYELIAVERVWHEFEKLAGRGRSISTGLNVLCETGWERHFPELAAIRDVPQDPRWHPEGPVHVHAGLAADRAVELADRDGLEGEARVHAVLAAMLHDLGKAGPGTQVVVDAEGEERIQSRGHEEYGANFAYRFLKRIHAPKHVADYVLPLIRNHMAAHANQLQAPTARQVRLLMRRLEAGPNPPTIEDWARLVDADTGGRGAASRDGVGRAWLEVAATIGNGYRAPRALIGGRHLIAAGVAPGPRFRTVIEASVAAQDDGAFDDEAGAIAWLNSEGLRLLSSG